MKEDISECDAVTRAYDTISTILLLETIRSSRLQSQ